MLVKGKFKNKADINNQLTQKKLNSPTGVSKLDNVLGGGFPKDAVILVAGSSGSGKTILSQQWLFEGLKDNENGIFITLTEPIFKIIKTLETMSFYDANAIKQEKLKIIDLRDTELRNSFNQESVLDFIENEVKHTNAKRLCIDSITAIATILNDKAEIRKFIFELGKILSSLGCTTILTSEVGEPGKFSLYGVEEFISDAILRLDQVKEKGELQRVMQIIKVRGRSYGSEELYFKISEQGIIVFPKLKVPLFYSSSLERISTGNPVLDQMMLSGVFKGSTTLIAGSAGTGKSLFSMQFIMDGLKKGEPGLYAGFEESREQLIRNAISMGWDLEKYEKKGLLGIRCTYPSQKFLEEHLLDIKEIIDRKKIQRCVIDSLSSISNSFDEDRFMGFAKKLNAYLKNQGVTTYFTSATDTLIGAIKLTGIRLSSLTDNIIMLRYVEMRGELTSVMNIVKVRGSAHSKGLRGYEITSKGIFIGRPLSGYEGIMSGVTKKVSETVDEKIESEFKKFVGPMTTSVFLKLKREGLTKENIINHIDELNKQGIVEKKEAKIFKRNILNIINTSLREEYGEEVLQEEDKAIKELFTDPETLARKDKQKKGKVVK